MKLAVISPAKALNKYSSMGDIHLVLAQEVLANEEYRKHYEKETKYKIIDNGLFENGQAVNLEQLLETAKAVKADEIILPDVLFKAKETVSSAKEALYWFKQHTKDGQFAYFVCPQASNAVEWVECYKELSQIPEIRTIGLSKLSIPHCWEDNVTEARNSCINTLISLGIFAKNKHHHLLGASNTVIDELNYYHRKGYSKWINSMDTSAPYFYGTNGKLLCENPELIPTKIDFSGEVDFANDEKVTKNINDLLTVVHRG